MDGTRSFLEKVLACGLDEGIVEPADVVRHVEPQVLAHHLPKELRAKLLAASLGAQAMTAELVVTTVGTLALCEHVPVHLLWRVLADCGPRAVGGEKAEGLRPQAPGPRPEDKKAEEKKHPEAAKPGAKSEPAKPEPAKPMSGGFKRVDTSPPAKIEPRPELKAESTKTDIKQIDDPMPKPNAKAKAEPPRPEPAKPAPAASKSGPAPSKSAPLSDRERTRTSPIVPRSEFEVDTDIGDFGTDDIVDIVEEAEAVGAMVEESPGDWPKADEETVNRFKKR